MMKILVSRAHRFFTGCYSSSYLDTNENVSHYLNDKTGVIRKKPTFALYAFVILKKQTEVAC